MRHFSSRFLPLAVLACIGLAAAIWIAISTGRAVPPPPLPSAPQQGPWPERISASGLIEGDGEDLSIGVPEAALIASVMVQPGQRVAKGDVLFILDDRLPLAEMEVAQAELAVARSGLAAAQTDAERLAVWPRPEDLPPLAARVEVAEAELSQALIRARRLERLFASNVVTADDIDQQRGAVRIARAHLAGASADLERARQPTWSPDVAVARAAITAGEARVQAAQARVQAAKIRIERLRIHAPDQATVVACRATPGRLAVPGEPDLLVLARLDRLLVRVEIDESQAWRLKAGSPGRGWLRGDPLHHAELRFHRVEPRGGPRRAIAGRPGERLDGRALQVLYHIVAPAPGMTPGLLLEVDIDAGTKG